MTAKLKIYGQRRCFAMNIKKQMFDFLLKNCVGPKNAFPIERIAGALGVSRRQIESASELIRNDGVALCSSTTEPFGIFIAERYEDAIPWIRQIDSRMRAMAAHRANAIRAIKKLAENDGVQLELGLSAD